MATSFRSAPEILAFVDEIFEGGGLERKFLAASANAPAPRYVRHISARTGRGAVELWPALEATEKVSAADPWSPVDAVDDAHARVRLACALAQRVRDDVDLGFAEPGDFLILCRRRSALFFEIIRRLKSAGLPTAGADRIVLAEHIAVQDMLAAARAGLAPWDDLSVAETLKGPFVRLDEIALYDLAALRPPGQRLWPCLREHADPRFGVAQTRLKDWIGAARRLSPFAFFSRLLNTVDPDGRSGAQALYARHGAEAQDAVEALLARALAHDRRGGPSLERFVVELSRDQGEVKREPEAVQNAVRVMTVHGAKGLEAPVVILPDTTQARPGRRAPGFFHDPDVGLIWSSKADLDPPAAAALRASAEDAAEAEDRRLLYVALTRARDRLIVCGHKTGRAPGKVEEDSWYALAEAAMARADGAAFDAPTGTGRRIGPAPEARVKAGPSQVSPKAHPPWLAEAAPKPEAVVAPLAPSRAILDQDGAALSPLAQPVTEGVARGRLTHALLERLPAMAPQARAAAADAYLRRHGPEAADARAAIWEAVRTVLEAPGFAAVFGPGSRAEAALAGPIRPGGPVASGVVDRLVVGADGIWVVDYKTNRDAVSRGEDAAPAHIAQMAAYKGVLSTLYPDRPVRCALLFTQAPALVPLPDSLLERALAEMTAG
ncbi:MAG: 3'-5' exonuclease [Maricaulaceae bacterium]